MHGQHRVDSLRRQVDLTEGKEKVDALNSLAFETTTANNNESAISSAQAYTLSEKISYEKGKAMALLYMAYNKHRAGQISRSDSLLFKSINLSHKIKESSIEGYGYACLSSNFQERGVLDSSKYYSAKSMNLLKSGDNPYYLSLLYNILADYYQLVVKPDSQLFFIKKSWAIRKRLREKIYLIYAGSRLAEYYTRSGDYHTALAYLDSSQMVMHGDTLANQTISSIWTSRAQVYTRLSNYKLASYFFEKAKVYYTRNFFPYELNKLLIEITGLYEEIGNYDEGLRSGFEALELAEKNKFPLQKTLALIRIGWSYFNLKQINLSEKYVLLAIESAEKFEQTIEEASAYNLYGQVLKEKNSKKAVYYYKKSLAIRIKVKDLSGQAELYSNFGEFFLQYSAYDSALYYHLLSLKIISQVHDMIGKSYALARIGHTYSKVNDYAKRGPLFRSGRKNRRQY